MTSASRKDQQEKDRTDQDLPRDQQKKLDYPGLRPGGEAGEEHVASMQEYEDRVATTRGVSPEHTSPEEEMKRHESGTGTATPGNFPEQKQGRWAQVDGEETRTATRKNIGDRLTSLVDPVDDGIGGDEPRGQGGSAGR